MGLTFPQYFSVWGCSKGSPYTSEVEARMNLALVRLARPSMFMVPRKLVLVVLIGLYLQPNPHALIAADHAHCGQRECTYRMSSTVQGGGDQDSGPCGDVLVVHRRCRASQVIDLVDFQQDGINNIVAN